MLKKIILILSCFITLCGQAQLYQSPYTSIGSGDLLTNYAVSENMMGGTGISQAQQYYIPFQNPANFANRGYTTIEMSASIESRTTKSTVGAINNKSGALNNLSFAFPIYVNKIGGGFGIEPFTLVNYSSPTIITTGTVDGEDYEVQSRNTGEGGISRATFSAGFRLLKGFNIGTKVSILFGSIESNSKNTLTSNTITGLYQTNLKESNTVRSSLFEFGATYKKYFDENKAFSFGAIYRPKKELSSNYERSGEIIITSRIDPIISVEKNKDNPDKISIPQKMGFGVSYELINKLIISLDYVAEAWGDTAFRQSDNIKNQNSNKIALGVQYIPKFDDVNSYLKRVIYRAGLNYNTGQYVLNSEKISELGINFGISFPMKGLSLLNAGFTIGQRGMVSEGIVKEEFYKFTFGFSFNDKWFIKRKLN